MTLVVTSIYMMFAFNGFLIASALIIKDRKSNIFLSALLLIISLIILNNAVLPFTNYYSSFHAIPPWTLYAYVWLPALVYFTVQSICLIPIKKPEILSWLLPGVVIILVLDTCYYSGKYFNTSLLSNRIIEVISYMDQIVGIGGLIVVVSLSFRKIRAFNDNLQNHYSDIHMMQLDWLLRMLRISIVIVVVWIFALIGRYVGLSIDISFIMSILSCCVILFTGFRAFLQPEIFVGCAMNEEDQPKEKISDLFSNYDDHCELERLEKHMLVDKLFTTPQLSVKQLAEALGLPIRYVSNLINKYHNMSFHDYINGFRIDEFKRLAGLKEYRHYNLLGLAQEVGFNSKSSLYYAFRKILGVTPADYVKKRRKNTNK